MAMVKAHMFKKFTDDSISVGIYKFDRLVHKHFLHASWKYIEGEYAKNRS